MQYHRQLWGRTQYKMGANSIRGETGGYLRVSDRVSNKRRVHDAKFKTTAWNFKSTVESRFTDTRLSTPV